MQVDTGTFQALTAEAEFLRRRLEEFDEDAAERIEVSYHYLRGYRDAEQGAAMRPGRHARPHGAHRGHLKLVSGGAR